MLTKRNVKVTLNVAVFSVNSNNYQLIYRWQGRGELFNERSIKLPSGMASLERIKPWRFSTFPSPIFDTNMMIQVNDLATEIDT